MKCAARPGKQEQRNATGTGEEMETFIHNPATCESPGHGVYWRGDPTHGYWFHTTPNPREGRKARPRYFFHTVRGQADGTWKVAQEGRSGNGGGLGSFDDYAEPGSSIS